ncbi:HAD-like domain-containing protein [Mycena rebaudengoi]|nr:HAD-like domain-containing protein [Mycena rebaudengoi]
MPHFPKIEYVLFDMDGLLLDTESIYTQVTNEILAPYGKVFTWDIKAGCMGKSAYESALHVLSYFPDVPLTVDAYLAQISLLQEQLWPTAKFLPGAQRLVQHLHTHGIPIAVATSSRRGAFKLKTQNHAEVFGCFGAKVVCGDDAAVVRGKPNPDIFLTAAEVLGRNVGGAGAEVSAAQQNERGKGLVFEDALLGIQAGKRAGMSVVWVPDAKLLNVEYTGAEKADQVLTSLEDFVPEGWGLPAYDLTPSAV